MTSRFFFIDWTTYLWEYTELHCLIGQNFTKTVFGWPF